MAAKILFILGAIFAATPFCSPPIALALGLVFGWFFTHPYRSQASAYSKKLLQYCVIGLGFGMNLHEVLRAGSAGFLYTAAGIAFTLLLGSLLGKTLNVTKTTAYLVSIGTAICGASAIAAVGPVTEANEEEMSVSLGTVFILNSIALLTFPTIGALLGLSQEQFGLWAALAIHDTSSVVGASAKYGAAALTVGVTVKLARALWIVPLTIGTALFQRHKASIKWPWFIAFFMVAALINTYVPAGKQLFQVLVLSAKAGLAVTLYLIGSTLSRATLKRVGWRPFAQGLCLWLIVGTLSLLLIRAGWL
ncbi:MAG TPA: putative sulfate exporter family transporter [Blastocatellia bacterium]|nr:putative sulfate exporter family transporter [Blastocatellia bacterium]